MQYQRKGHRSSIDDFMPIKPPKKEISKPELQAKFDMFFGQQKELVKHGR